MPPAEIYQTNKNNLFELGPIKTIHFTLRKQLYIIISWPKESEMMHGRSDPDIQVWKAFEVFRKLQHVRQKSEYDLTSAVYCFFYFSKQNYRFDAYELYIQSVQLKTKDP